MPALQMLSFILCRQYPLTILPPNSPLQRMMRLSEEVPGLALSRGKKVLALALSEEVPGGLALSKEVKVLAIALGTVWNSQPVEPHQFLDVDSAEHSRRIRNQ